MKKVELKENFVGGIDLLTERGAGNEVLILTGKKESSLKFWKKLRKLSDTAIEKIQSSK